MYMGRLDDENSMVYIAVILGIFPCIYSTTIGHEHDNLLVWKVFVLLFKIDLPL